MFDIGKTIQVKVKMKKIISIYKGIVVGRNGENYQIKIQDADDNVPLAVKSLSKEYIENNFEVVGE